MKIKDAEKNGVTHMVCSKLKGDPRPISEFRKHKKGYYLTYCKQWECEEAKRRRDAKNGTSTSEKAVITITTASGVTYEASTTPIAGGRMGSSDKTDIVLYFGEGVTRDQVRSAFRAHTGVAMTGIKAAKVEA